MQLCFHNSYSSPLWVAVMWYNPGPCGGEGGNWATAGWWQVDPGGTVHTDVWTANRYFYIYAEAEDGAVWGGDYGPVYATNQAFQGCLNIANSQEFPIGMAQIDAGWWFWSYITYTMTLE